MDTSSLEVSATRQLVQPLCLSDLEGFARIFEECLDATTGFLREVDLICAGYVERW